MPPQSLFGSGEVAQRLGLPRWRLLYLIESGRLPGPNCRIPGRRLFSEEDVQNALAALQTLQDPADKAAYKDQANFIHDGNPLTNPD